MLVDGHQKFSVLMSVYANDCPLYLSQALQSIELQTVAPDEVLIVLDGPVDQSVFDVLLSFENRIPIKYLQLYQNFGLAVALKEGLEACTNDLVARMDSDDICEHDRFESQLRVYAANPSVDVVGGLIEEFSDDEPGYNLMRKVPEMHDDIHRRALLMSPVNHVTVMYKKSAVIECGNYKNFKGIEDYPLWVQMLSSGKRFYNLQKILVRVRTGKDFINRRGGLKYALDELKALKWMYSVGFIGGPIFLVSLAVRFGARLSGARFRRLIYRMLRKRPISSD